MTKFPYLVFLRICQPCVSFRVMLMSFYKGFAFPGPTACGLWGRRWEKPRVHLRSLRGNPSFSFFLSDLGFGEPPRSTVLEFKLSSEVSSWQAKSGNGCMFRIAFSDRVQMPIRITTRLPHELPKVAIRASSCPWRNKVIYMS